jgi:hypothetical protein
MAKADSITAEQARAVLSYSAETGKFFRTDLDRYTGTINAHGYVVISLLGCKAVKAHRLAWLLHYGSWPEHDLDHINGDRADNRIQNLRLSVGSLNAQNQRRPRSDNKSGCLGVSWSKVAQKWTARIKIGSKYKHLGLFLTVEEASSAYLTEKRLHHAGCTI